MIIEQYDKEKKNEVILPILTYQRLTSMSYELKQLKTAQLVVAKCVIQYNKYTLGWYILFLLSLYNNDKVS
jgi:hypothetical protein